MNEPDLKPVEISRLEADVDGFADALLTPKGRKDLQNAGWNESAILCVQLLAQEHIAARHQSWVRTVDALPDEYGHYFITFRWADEGYDYDVTTALYRPDIGWECPSTLSEWEITAWMPLPEPYKSADAEVKEK